MKKVQFPLVKDGALIIYPDDISLFSDTAIVGETIVGNYSGSMELDEYVESVIVEPVIISKLAFRRLLTLAEKIAFDNFETNSSLTDEQKAILRTFTKDYEMADEVTLNDADLISGMQYLEVCGLLAAGRSAEILGG